MALKDIQLANISPVNRAANRFIVTAYSDNGKKQATFNVTGEANAIALRNAIREHADALIDAKDYSR